MTRYSWRNSHPSLTTGSSAEEDVEAPADESFVQQARRRGLLRVVVGAFRMDVPPTIPEDDGEDVMTEGYSDEEYLEDEIRYVPSESDIKDGYDDALLHHEDSVLKHEAYADPPDDVDESVALLMQDELNAEMQVLKQQVAANRNELRRFEKRAAISRKNRKESVQELNEKIDMGEEEPVLPPDAYSFFAIADFIAHSNSCCHYPQLSFAIALSVFIFQLLTLSFLVTDYVIDFADAQNAGNRLGVPSGVDWTVQVCQLIALAITVISQDEVRTSLNALFDGYKAGAFDAQDCFSSSRLKWNISACLRLLIGLLSLALTFIFIITSANVRDLLLNFTAVEFISSVDNTVFLLTSWGYFGPRAQKDADIIVNAKPVRSPVTDQEKRLHDASASTIDTAAESSSEPRVQRRCRYSRRALILLAIWAVMLGFWLWLSLRQGYGDFLPKTVSVQFGDEFLPALGTFSGLYSLDEYEGFPLFGGKKTYISHAYGDVRPSAKFEYCRNQKAWTFSFGNKGELVDDPCNKGKHFIRAQSSQTSSFDVTETASASWFYRKDNTSLLPLQHFSMRPHSEESCVHGVFDRNSDECVCSDKWVGLNCQFDVPCKTLQTTRGVFNTTRPWSSTYSLLPQNGADSPPVQVYNRPVFVGNTTRAGNTDVMFFSGRRWVLTHTGRFKLGTDNTSDLSNMTGIADFFANKFHGYWTNYTVSFLSEAVDVDTPNVAATPIRLFWYPTLDSLDDKSRGIQAPDLTARNEGGLICRCSDKNKCQHEGQCLEDGTCDCTNSGSTGLRCENQPTGNGLCNPYFNKQVYDFDGGDCCRETCRANEYECGTDVEGTYIGFPYCKDKEHAKVNNSICDLSLNNEQNEYDGGDCCKETCVGDSCGKLLDSVFGGSNNAFPYCSNPDVVGNESGAVTNLTIQLELGLHPENTEILFRCGNETLGNSTPGTFGVPAQNRTGRVVVKTGSKCEIQMEGNETGKGSYKVYLGDHASLNAGMLIAAEELGIGGNEAFRASHPEKVDIEAQVSRADSMLQVNLGLLCHSKLEDHDFSSLPLDFNDSGNATVTVPVRKGSTCRFDESGKQSYSLFYQQEGTSEKGLLLDGDRTDNAKTQVFFEALPQVEMVRVVADVELHEYSDKTEISLRCNRGDEIEYFSREMQQFEGSQLVREVFLAPNGSQCVFTIRGPSSGTFELFYDREDTDDEPLFAGNTTSGLCERVFFTVGPQADAVPVTILYRLHNMPSTALAGFDLRCNNTLNLFPVDPIGADTRAAVLVPDGTSCNFTIPGVSTSNPSCPQGEGEGFYRVYYGIDTLPNNLLARGSQIQGESASFVASSPSPPITFDVNIQLGNKTNGTSLKVHCDNVLEIEEFFKDEVGLNKTLPLNVKDGSSCELDFTRHHPNDHFQVVYRESNASLFQDLQVGDRDRVLFMASSLPWPLVPITLDLDLNGRTSGTPSDNIGLRMSCDMGDFNVYYSGRGNSPDRQTTDVFLLPDGAECELLIVDIGNKQCCADENKGAYKVKNGNETVADGEFSCRVRSETFTVGANATTQSFTVGANATTVPPTTVAPEPTETTSTFDEETAYGGLRALLRQVMHD